MNALNCESFEDRLNTILDQREKLQNDSSLLRHARICEDCAKTVRAYGAITTALTGRDKILDRVHDAESDITLDGIVHRVSQHPVSRRFWAIAASAALILCGVWGFPRSSTPVASAPSDMALTENYHNEMVNVSNAQTEPNIGSSQASIHFFTLVPQLSSMIPMQRATTVWESVRAPTLLNLEPVTNPMRPLANSMTSTINVLRRTIPLGRERHTTTIVPPPQTSGLMESLASIA